MRRVLSDARVKEVLGDFTLGGETLLKVVPRLFRYKGQAQHERPYVGIIAQVRSKRYMHMHMHVCMHNMHMHMHMLHMHMHMHMYM